MREEVIGRLVQGHLAAGDVLVDLTLTTLPVFGPEPCLVGRNRQCRAQLDHTVIAFKDLDLRSRLIQMHPSAELAGQCDESAGLQPDVAVESHTTTMPDEQRSRNTALLMCRVAVIGCSPLAWDSLTGLGLLARELRLLPCFASMTTRGAVRDAILAMSLSGDLADRADAAWCLARFLGEVEIDRQIVALARDSENMYVTEAAVEALSFRGLLHLRWDGEQLGWRIGSLISWSHQRLRSSLPQRSGGVCSAESAHAPPRPVAGSNPAPATNSVNDRGPGLLVGPFCCLGC